ncbi:uncharacterized protein EI90DRAFT_1902723 [Cantharellus anzutake]|uniref:uncharacterized protein n=1 Tax=Cantharellus anzutake TaxID=1750568 RepID=UPI0019070ED3|nr:uncharacterized protein EI90DRAFT_1902723 [Cantharellus anzutake]KAF8326540.1 hypothetical protein EI90DRAFT_1902723 [Cantharellus anzutake]
MDLFGIGEEQAMATSTVAEPSYKKFQRDFESNLFDSQPGDPLPDIDDNEPNSGAASTGMEHMSSAQPSFTPLPGSQSDSQLMPQELFSASGHAQESESKSRGKRKASDKGDTDMQDANVMGSRPRKRQAMVEPELVGPKDAAMSSHQTVAVRDESQTTKKTRGGAAENGVDTDSQFLHAMATTKRGKRTEDEFDREFNNLRISKPRNGDEVNIERERRRREELEAFEEMEKDFNVHGNFMVVIESDDLFRKDGGKQPTVPSLENNMPNFKKFKKKVPPRRAAMVEIVPDKTMDYGQGKGYWEKEKSPIAPLEESYPPLRPQARRGRSGVSRPQGPRRPLRVEDSASDAENHSDVSLPKRLTGKGGARAKQAPKEYEPNDSDLNFSDVDTRLPGTLRSSGRARRKPPPAADDEDELEDFGDVLDAIGPDVSDLNESLQSQTIKSSAPTAKRPPAASPPKAPPVPSMRVTRSASQAPSEDPAASQVTTRSTRATTRKRPRVMQDSDSDGAGFHGFSVSSKRSKR